MHLTPTLKGNTTSYEIERFMHHPGIYFEKLGRLHHIESFWKVVVKVDVMSLSKRLAQLEKYALKTDNMCKLIAIITKDTCGNLNTVIKKGCERINRIILQINTMYRAQPLQKRGLVDGIGVIAKSLFGTMDANDEKLINEQLTILHDSQELTKHAIKNQLKVIQATISHLNNTEKIIQHNEYVLANATQNLRNQLVENEHQSNAHENFIIINAVLEDLTRDAEDVLEYLMFTKKEIMHPRLTPVKAIIEAIKDANTHVRAGLYFPFRAEERDWPTIEKLAKIGAIK